jgi:hypothetical protein
VRPWPSRKESAIKHHKIRITVFYRLLLRRGLASQ